MTEITENKLSIEMKLPDDLVSKITNAATAVAIEEIRLRVKENILQKSNSWKHTSDEDRQLQDWVIELVKETISDNRDVIIEKAATNLADSMRRSKLVREKFGDLLEEELNDGK